MGFARWQWHYNRTQHTKIHVSQHDQKREITTDEATQTTKDTTHARSAATGREARGDVRRRGSFPKNSITKLH
jgi:hypothetical protein